MDEYIPPQCRELVHTLNRRCSDEFDRAERLHAELDDIKRSRAWVIFRLLRGLRRWFWKGPPSCSTAAPAKPPAVFFESVTLPSPKVSIIIPFRDQLALLRNCLRSLRRGMYRRLEIVLVDNASAAPDMVRYLERMSRRRGFRVVYCPGVFNFARVCNLGAQHASGEYLLFLNNDVEV